MNVYESIIKGLEQAKNYISGDKTGVREDFVILSDDCKRTHPEKLENSEVEIVLENLKNEVSE